MSLREALSELIGAEIQEHPITLNGKTKLMQFRQISDAEGREVFRPIEGESDADRGRRVVDALVAKSTLDDQGNPSTLEEVERLPRAIKEALFQAAAKTNNIPLQSDAQVEGDESPKG
jgi:hypothetical protein